MTPEQRRVLEDVKEGGILRLTRNAARPYQDYAWSVTLQNGMTYKVVKRTAECLYRYAAIAPQEEARVGGSLVTPYALTPAALALLSEPE